MNWPRLVVAFVIAPAVPALLLAILGLLTSGSGVLAVLLVACLATYAHAVVLGVPTVWLLARSKLFTLWHVVGAAFLVGALPFGAFTVYQESTFPLGAGYTSNGVVLRDDGHLTSAGLRSAVFDVLQCGFLGAATGFVWWLIALPRRRGQAK